LRLNAMMNALPARGEQASDLATALRGPLHLETSGTEAMKLVVNDGPIDGWHFRQLGLR
jgi:hypothetical protein